MKKYKAKIAFSSPVFGNVKIGDIVTLDESLGNAMKKAGVIEEIEVKPAVEEIEVKPVKRKKKENKGK